MQEMRETWAGSPGQEDSPGEGSGTPLQYSCLGNPMEPGGLQSMGSQKWDMIEGLNNNKAVSEFPLYHPGVTNTGSRGPHCAHRLRPGASFHEGPISS